jgi:hypothetical protein
MEALWIWVQSQGATVAVLALVSWRLDAHLSQFRTDLNEVHRQVLEIMSRSLNDK